MKHLIRHEWSKGCFWVTWSNCWYEGGRTVRFQFRRIGADRGLNAYSLVLGPFSIKLGWV